MSSCNLSPEPRLFFSFQYQGPAALHSQGPLLGPSRSATCAIWIIQYSCFNMPLWWCRSVVVELLDLVSHSCHAKFLETCVTYSLENLTYWLLMLVCKWCFSGVKPSISVRCSLGIKTFVELFIHVQGASHLSRCVSLPRQITSWTFLTSDFINSSFSGGSLGSVNSKTLSSRPAHTWASCWLSHQITCFKNPTQSKTLFEQLRIRFRMKQEIPLGLDELAQKGRIVFRGIRFLPYDICTFTPCTLGAALQQHPDAGPWYRKLSTHSSKNPLYIEPKSELTQTKFCCRLTLEQVGADLNLQIGLHLSEPTAGWG